MARTPKRLVSALFLQEHKSCQLATSSWDAIYRKVIYRSDPISLFATAPLKVELVDVSPAAGELCGRAKEEPRDGLARDVVAGGTYNSLMHGAALQFLLHHKFSCAAQKEVAGRCFLSTDLHPSAIRNLTSMLARERSHTIASLDSMAAPEAVCNMKFADALAKYGLDRHSYFTLVDNNPAAAKRAQKGDLRTSDLGITLHRFMETVSIDFPVVRVDPTPWAYLAADERNFACASTALVLRLHDMSLEVLRGLHMWIADDDVGFSLEAEHDGFDAEPDPRRKLIASALLHSIASSGAQGCDVRLLDGDEDARATILSTWERSGLVKQEHRGEARLLSLTQQGRMRLRTGVTLRSPCRLLASREIPVNELSIFELMEWLEVDGWTCHIAATKDDNKKSKGRAV